MICILSLKLLLDIHVAGNLQKKEYLCYFILHQIILLVFFKTMNQNFLLTTTEVTVVVRLSGRGSIGPRKVGVCITIRGDQDRALSPLRKFLAYSLNGIVGKKCNAKDNVQE